MVEVVAIDGPVAVGKSSVARAVATSLGYRHLDTGAMYRIVALKSTSLPENQKTNPEKLGEIAQNTEMEIRADGSIFADGQDVTSDIRDEKISRLVSKIADHQTVREALVAQQRSLGQKAPSVLEGRDIGTVVFPDAFLKIYLDASPEVRAKRRVLQLEKMGKAASFEEVSEALAARDRNDQNRPWGALKIAEDAILIDTSCMDQDHVVDLICALAKEERSQLKAVVS